jgi:hypothetical protein
MVVSRHTYAEREFCAVSGVVLTRTLPPGVLGAFSQLQREHKKRAVHIASLRAQGQAFLYSDAHRASERSIHCSEEKCTSEKG